jgi:hypothetical protein
MLPFWRGVQFLRHAGRELDVEVTVAAPNKVAAGGVSSGPANGNRSTRAPVKWRKGFG